MFRGNSRSISKGERRWAERRSIGFMGYEGFRPFFHLLHTCFHFQFFFCWYCCLLPRPKYLKMAWKIKWNQSNALACGCGNRPINGKGMNGVIYFGGQLFTHYIDHNPVESDFIYSKSYRYNSKTLSSLGVPYLSFALSRRWRFDKYFTTFSWLAAVVGTHKIFYQFGSFRANINLWQNDE